MFEWLEQMLILSKLTSDLFLVKPVEDQVVCLLTLELWRHVSSSVNGCESQIAIVSLEVAGHLVVNDVWSPVLSGLPSQGWDPFLRANCWDCTIDVSWVEEHSVFALEFLVDPLWTLLLDHVMNVSGAELPCLDVSWDVQVWSDFPLVQVLLQRSAPGAGWQLSQLLAGSLLEWAFEPWAAFA